jgi:hypothetical protein
MNTPRGLGRTALPAKPVKLLLSQQIFDTEVRLSQQAAERLPKGVVNAVLKATEIYSFYKNHPTDMIMQRDVTQILRQMGSKNVLICELGAKDKRIVASSILWDDDEFPIVMPNGDIEVKRLLETGTQQCIMPGYNLQWTLNAFSLLNALSTDATGTYFAATYGNNNHSIANFLNNMKFAEWDVVPSTVECVRMHHLAKEKQTDRGVRWFRPNLETVVRAAQRIVDFIDHPIQPRKELRRSLESNEVDVVAIEFEYDRRLERAVHYARKILAEPPRTLADLSSAIENDRIDADFLQTTS